MGEGVILRLGVSVVVGVPVGDEPCVEDPVTVRVFEGVWDVVKEPVRLGVCVRVPVGLVLRLPVLEGVPVPDGVGEGVGVIVPVLVLVRLGVPVEEVVRVRLELPVGLVVRVLEGVWEGVPEREGVPVRLGDCVAVFVPL